MAPFLVPNRIFLLAIMYVYLVWDGMWNCVNHFTIVALSRVGVAANCI